MSESYRGSLDEWKSKKLFTWNTFLEKFVDSEVNVTIPEKWFVPETVKILLKGIKNFNLIPLIYNATSLMI